jgi:glutathione S-transferase
VRLFWSSRSPFVRKVMVAAHEVGIAGRIQPERVVVAANKPNPDVMAVNPLNKIPTLVLDDGSALYDSRVICEYFDTLRRQALGDGLMEASVLRVGEQARPREAQSEGHLAAYRLKIAGTLDVLEREAEGLAGPIGIGHIAIGCALAHLDFRFAAADWRAGRPKLAAWYAGFAGRPSMQATAYVDAY